jgi:DNA-binding MarR family transcriptional regulator
MIDLCNSFVYKTCLPQSFHACQCARVEEVDELGRLLGPLRRAVLRRTRALAELPDLAEAQIEVLRLLEREPGLFVREVAARLRIAPSTVSNLLRALAAEALIERTSSPSDMRAVQLYPSAQALKLLHRYDKVSRSILTESIAQLSAADRKALQRAMPALARLLERLDQGT